MTEKDAAQLFEGIAREMCDRIDDDALPGLEIPVRALSNVSYEAARGGFELGGATKLRGLGPRTARSFAQTLKMMALSKELVETGDFATKREAYYVSKNWEECRFDEQAESDSIMDDLEAIASLKGLSREDLGFHPEAHGGSVVGELTIIDRDPERSESTEIDCRRLGAGAYTIPWTVERLELVSDARFVLAIETGGMFQRLNKHRFWQEHRCVLVELAGVPTRATRRFVRRLSDQTAIPVYCFTDCDPYGFANIYRTLKVGSGNAAHISSLFSVPTARFLGVTPEDIEVFELADATHPLTDSDRKRVKDALAHDPFFRQHEAWRQALGRLVEMGVRAEQQALAKWGLNFVIEEYLPRKLAQAETFLP